MKCEECGQSLPRLDNQHLADCCGLTVQEYAIRHCLPLDLVLHSDQINTADDPADFPSPVRYPSEHARAVLRGLQWAGILRHKGGWVEVPGEVRRLDLLRWTAAQLADFGFVRRQEYTYANDTHRVVARNLLRAPAGHLLRPAESLSMTPPPDFLDTLAAFTAHVAEWHAGYLFLPFADAAQGETVRETLARDHGITCVTLAADGWADGALLRSRTLADTDALLALLGTRLHVIPSAWARFHEPTPEATVSKEVVFDAAHFITDHPAKCSNLHGGRYVLQVQVTGRIDPMTGCVIDFGYLKRVVNRRVVDRFDHHHLNYAAPELAWRSSTEMLCAHIWECLIEYLPGLSELRLFETTQSRCDYRGPTLAEFQAQGPARVLRAFAPDRPAHAWGREPAALPVRPVPAQVSAVAG